MKINTLVDGKNPSLFRVDVQIDEVTDLGDSTHVSTVFKDFSDMCVYFFRTLPHTLKALQDVLKTRFKVF